MSEKSKLPYQAVRYRGYMIMNNRVKVIIFKYDQAESY